MKAPPTYTFGVFVIDNRLGLINRSLFLVFGAVPYFLLGALDALGG
jgi:hypothetical protein